MGVRYTLVAALAGALAVGAVSAQAAPRGHGWKGGYMQFLQGVTLTEGQVQQIHDIRKAAWVRMKPEVKALRTVHERIEAQLASTGNVTSDSLAALQQQESQIRQDLDQQRLATAMQVRAVLTPAQLGQAATAHGQLVTLHAQIHAILHQGQVGAAAQ